MQSILQPTFQTILLTIIVVVLVYLILAYILTISWNNSVKKIFNNEHDLTMIEGLFLLLTVNILFGTFNQCGYVINQTM